MPTTSETFPLFSAFPKDIRLLIWEFSLPEPRIVHIKQVETSTGREEHNGYYLPAWVMRSYSRIPSLLHVNIEAREIASRFYTPAFRCSFPVSKDAPYIWFDFNRDFLLFERDTFEDLHGCHPSSALGIKDLPKTDLCRVKNLVFDSTSWWVCSPKLISYILYLLGGVENLVFCTNRAMGHLDNPRRDTALRDLRYWDADGDDQIDVEGCFKKYDLKRDERHPRLTPGRIPIANYRTLNPKDLAHVVSDTALKHQTTITSYSYSPTLVLSESTRGSPENQQLNQQGESAINNDESAWEDFNPRMVYLAEMRPASRIPNIQYKVILSARVKEALEKAREEYYLRIKQNVEAHKSHASRICNCRRRSSKSKQTRPRWGW